MGEGGKKREIPWGGKKKEEKKDRRGWWGWVGKGWLTGYGCSTGYKSIKAKGIL